MSAADSCLVDCMGQQNAVKPSAAAQGPAVLAENPSFNLEPGFFVPVKLQVTLCTLWLPVP